jgi:uncharacterized protein (TIGR02001 family)
MKKVVFTALAALAVSAAMPAFAADMPVKAKMVAPAPVTSPWDIAFGTAFATDYRLRGVSQSNRHASVSGYAELDYTFNEFFKVYAGIAGYSLWQGYGADAEFDFSGGVRLSYNNFGLDVGYIYYDYVGSNPNFSFGDFYAKPSYKVNDWLTIAGIVDYGSNNANGVGIVGSKDEGFYAINAVITLPLNLPYGIGVSVNPEIGRQWASCTGCTNFTYWDVGLDFNYKAMTLDLRYWDTNVNRSNVAFITGTGTFTAGQAFVATLKFDTTMSALK